MLEANAAQFDKDVSSNTDFSYIKCGFEVEFASSVSRQDIGSRIRNFTNIPVNVSSKYGTSQGGSYTGFGVENDTSIVTDRIYRVPVEVVSPILGFEEMLRQLDNVFKMVSSYGQTNSSTGLHISFSRNDIHLQDAKFDPLKLMLFLGEHYWAKIFGRERNDFAKQVLSRVALDAVAYARDNKHVVTFKDCVDAVNKFSSVGWRELANSDDKSDFAVSLATSLKRLDRKSSINLTHLVESKRDRVEFRLMGGTDYHHKFDLVANLARRFAYALWASCSGNGDKYNAEYAAKLYRLIRKDAGNPSITEELATSVTRMRKTGVDKANKSTVYAVDHIYKYKGQSGLPSISQEGTAAFDKSGNIVDLAGDGTGNSERFLFSSIRDGKLKNPDGRVLDMADVIYATTLKNGTGTMAACAQEWLSGSADPVPLTDMIGRIHQVEPALVQRYGKLGARQMARIVSCVLASELFSWLAGTHIRSGNKPEGAAYKAVMSGDYSAIRENVELLQEYIKRYSKFMDEGTELSTLGHLKDTLNAFIAANVDGPLWSRKSYSVKFNVHIMDSRVIEYPYGTLSCLAIQRAMGRDDLATVTALRALTGGDERELLKNVPDWSFLDARAIRACPTKTISHDFEIDIYRAKEKPLGFARQYLSKAGKDIVTSVASELLLTAGGKEFNSIPAMDSWYMDTDIPAIDKASKAIFDKRIKVLSQSPVLSLLNSRYNQGKAELYSFLTRATDADMIEVLKDGRSLGALTAGICAVSASTSTIPDNPAIARVLNNPIVQASFLDAIRHGQTPLCKDIFGVNRIQYIESLADPSIAQYDTGYLIGMFYSGVPADFTLGPVTANWFTRSVRSTTNQGQYLSNVLHKLGVFGTDKDGKYTVVRQVASPLIAAVLKKDKQAVSDVPALGNVLPAGYVAPKATR